MNLDVPVLVLDFETYSDSDYSLAKLPIASYVNDPRFHAHGLAVMHSDGRTVFRVDVGTVLGELQQQYGPCLEQALVVMHNACFDDFILRHRYGLAVRNVVDTLSLSRLVNGPTQPAGLAELARLHDLPPKGELATMKGVRTPTPEQLAALGEYAIRDAEISRRLLDLYLPLALRTPQELTTMAHTIRMFVEKPFVVDLQAVDEGQAILVRHVCDLVAATGHGRVEISGEVSFARLMAEALARSCRQTPTKPGKNGPIPAFGSKDDAMVALLTDEDNVVRGLAQARVAVKSASAQLKRFDFLRKSAAACGGRFHAELTYHGAHTGRFSGGGGFNIQNLSDPDRRPGELEKRVAVLLRQAICARSGCVLVGCDASQIEARIVAWVAPEPALHQAFADGTDVYCDFASKVFGQAVVIPVEDAPEYVRMYALRAIGKVAILALGYGMGYVAFIARLKQSAEARQLFAEGVLTPECCRAIVAQYRTTYAAIPGLWRRCEVAFRDAVAGMESTVNGVRFFKVRGDVLIELPSGRQMRYPRASLHLQDRAEYRQTDDDDSYDLRPCRMELVYSDLRTGTELGLFGGKLVNNIASGIARDILVDVIIRLEREGWPVVSHCHDSVICQCVPEKADECRAAMVAAWRAVPSWAPGLVLDARGKVGRSFAEIA